MMIEMNVWLLGLVVKITKIGNDSNKARGEKRPAKRREGRKTGDQTERGEDWRRDDLVSARPCKGRAASDSRRVAF